MARKPDTRPPPRAAAREQSLQQAVRFHQQGRLDEAEAIYRDLLRSGPADHRVLNLAGLAGFQRGDVDLSVRFLARAADLAPAVAKYRYDLGVVEQTRGQLAESVRHYEAALALDAGAPAAWENLGVALADQGRNAGAIEAFERALALNPTSALALGNLATLRRWQGDHEAALALLERGLAADPLNAELRMKRAETLLATGHYAAGWDDYAWRFVHGDEWGARPTAFVPLPKWSGEPLDNKCVLLHAEQGIGDEVMFASCLPDLAATPARFTLLCDPRLAPAMARSFPWLAVAPNVAGAGETVAADVRIPLGDLPRVFRASDAAFAAAARGPYLHADAAARGAWRRRLDALGPGPKIGLSWRGGATPRTRQARSVPLAALAPLFGVAGAQVISLQYGDCAAELAAAPAAVRDGLVRFPDVDPLTDLDGLFALVSELDLVVTVDNSTVHFAGALGATAWLLAPALADWRWPASGAGSRWYDSVRLFRQAPDARGDSGDWGDVVQSVTDALRAFTPRRPPAPVAVSAVSTCAAADASRAGARATQALLVNDTSHWYHWGCTCTSLAIREQLRAGGRAVQALPIGRLAGLRHLPASRADLADDALFDRFRRDHADLCALLAGADEVVVNGEGSLHGATHTSLALLWLAWLARRRFDKPVRIINHSCYPTGGAHAAGGPVEDFYREVYGCMDAVVVREPLSAALLASLDIPATTAFDCLPLYAEAHRDAIVREATDHLLIAGSVAAGPAMAEACARVAEAGRAAGLRPLFLFGANANLAADDREFARALSQSLARATGATLELFHATSEAEWLSAIAGARLLVSGRFHYSIAAACLGTPFVALDSNTPKMAGLMQALGLARPADAAPADLVDRALALLADPAPALVDERVRAGLAGAARRNFAWLPGPGVSRPG